MALFNAFEAFVNAAIMPAVSELYTHILSFCNMVLYYLGYDMKAR